MWLLRRKSGFMHFACARWNRILYRLWWTWLFLLAHDTFEMSLWCLRVKPHLHHMQLFNTGPYLFGSFPSFTCFVLYAADLSLSLSPSLPPPHSPPSYSFQSCRPIPGIHPNNISHPDLFWSWSHVTINIVTDPGRIDLPVSASTAISCLITTLWNPLRFIIINIIIII